MAQFSAYLAVPVEARGDVFTPSLPQRTSVMSGMPGKTERPTLGWSPRRVWLLPPSTSWWRRSHRRKATVRGVDPRGIYIS